MSDTGRTYTGVNFGLELGVTSAGMLLRADGGDAFADVVEVVEADGTRSKRLGGMHFADISLVPAGDLDPVLLEWLRASLEAKYVAKDGAVNIVSSDGTVKQRLEFQQALVREIRFPALDALSSEVARLVVTLSPETTRRQPGAGQLPGTRATKPPLASNFRLQIDGLDCSRVTRIDELVVRTVTAEDASGELRQYEKLPVRLECSDLVVTLPEAGAGTFSDWHDRFVRRGLNDKSAEKNGTLEILEPSLQSSRLTVELRGLGIHRLVSATSSEGQRTVTASMYCHSIAFPRPPAPPPPPAAAPPAAEAPPVATADTILGGRVVGDIPTRIGRLPPPTG